MLSHIPEFEGEELKAAVLPLVVQYKCGHCPKALFGVLITHLMNFRQRSAHNFTHITLIEDKIFKYQVSFEIRSPGVRDELTLKVHAAYLEIEFYPEHSEDRCTSIAEVCSNSRMILEESILSSLKHLCYNDEPLLCLKCDQCLGVHEVERGSLKLHCEKTRKGITIPHEGNYWFSKG